MCDDQLLRICGPATLLARLEAICVALERIQDAVVVCSEACEAGTAECTAVARTLKHGASMPLGTQLSLLSSMIVSLKENRANPLILRPF
jgi:hypothetical protein